MTPFAQSIGAQLKRVTGKDYLVDLVKLRKELAAAYHRGDEPLAESIKAEINRLERQQ